MNMREEPKQTMNNNINYNQFDYNQYDYNQKKIIEKNSNTTFTPDLAESQDRNSQHYRINNFDNRGFIDEPKIFDPYSFQQRNSDYVYKNYAAYENQTKMNDQDGRNCENINYGSYTDSKLKKISQNNSKNGVDWFSDVIPTKQNVATLNPNINQSCKNMNNSEKSDDESDEGDLLTELGISPISIINRVKHVILQRSMSVNLLDSLDMTGPIIILFVFCICLLINGKIQFGYVYTFTTCGTLLLYALLNFLSENNFISIYITLSILGYSLIPLIFVAVANLLFNLINIYGYLYTTLCLGWCTFTATSAFENILSIKERRFMVAYPVLLFYTSFALLTLF